MEIESALTILLDKLVNWFETGVAMLPNFIVASILLIAGWFAARLVGTLAGRGLNRLSKNRAIARLLAMVVRVVVLAGVGFAALGLLGLDRAVTSLLAGVGILGFALSFAFRDMAANFMSGIVMAFRRPFRVDDVVALDGIEGVVEEVNLRETLIRAFDGRQVLLPNRLVFEGPITNYTRTFDRRVEIAVGVSYTDDLEQALTLAREACESIEGRLEDRPAQALVTGFGGSSVDLSVRFWIKCPKGGIKPFLEARSEAIRAIKKAFDGAGISIPFPIRTLELPESMLDAGSAAPDNADDDTAGSDADSTASASAPRAGA